MQHGETRAILFQFEHVARRAESAGSRTVQPSVRAFDQSARGRGAIGAVKLLEDRKSRPVLIQRENPAVVTCLIGCAVKFVIAAFEQSSARIMTIIIAEASKQGVAT